MIQEKTNSSKYDNMNPKMIPNVNPKTMKMILMIMKLVDKRP